MVRTPSFMPVLISFLAFLCWPALAESSNCFALFSRAYSPTSNHERESDFVLAQSIKRNHFIEKGFDEVGITKQEIANIVSSSNSNLQPYQLGYQRIAELFSNPNLVFKYMAQLELEVWRLKQRRPWLFKKSALEKVLRKFETLDQVGFDRPLNLMREVYNKSDWRLVLKSGRPINDPYFRVGDPNENHGRLTHRIQWMVVALDYLAYGPEVYGGVRPVDLYKALGAFEPLAMDKLWSGLFDSRRTFNASFPEFFHSLRHYWPYLSGWD